MSLNDYWILWLRGNRLIDTNRFISEYEDIQVHDSFEFVLAYMADGLEDLEYHLMKQYAKGESCDIAIRRFLKRTRCYKTPFINKPCSGKYFEQISKEYIDSITQMRFKGVYTADLYTGNLIRDIIAFASKKVFMPKVIEKIIGKPSYIWPCHNLYLSIEPDNFYIETQKYIKKILESMRVDLDKPIVLDQPFEGNNPLQSMKFYKDSYAIVIDRDPRDLFLAGKYTKDPNFKFTPRNNVDNFITFYRSMRKHQVQNEKILYLKMEDLIYEYDISVLKIENFLNLSGKHINKKKFFNPERSINNTQLIRLHPDDINDIKKIEEELHEYLFQFEDYKIAEFKGTPFDGAEGNLSNNKMVGGLIL